MSEKKKFYTAYNRPPKVTHIVDHDDIKVDQQEGIINSLSYQLHRYGFDSLVARCEQMREKFGYADCTNTGDFRQLQQQYRNSIEYFEALPSEIRRQYQNRPENFFDDLSNNPEKFAQDGWLSPKAVEDLKGKVLEDEVSKTNPVVESPVEQPASGVTE